MSASFSKPDLAYLQKRRSEQDIFILLNYQKLICLDMSEFNYRLFARFILLICIL